MKKMNNDKKEALKQFLEDLLEGKFSKDQLLEKAGLKDADGDPEEVLVEPFALSDVDNDLHEFMNLNDLVDLDNMQLNEEDLLYNPLDQIELTEEELEYYNALASNVKPVNLLMMECVVGGENKLLVDGSNCSIKAVPIMSFILLSPVNLQVLKVMLDSDMESEEEIELTVGLKQDEQMVVYKFDLATLAMAGLVVITDSLDDKLELKPLEFRGLTTPVSTEEIVGLLSKLN